MVNGESVLRIILSFIAFLSSSISLFILRNSFSILDKFPFDVLILLLAWLSNPSSLWFPSFLRCFSSFWFSIIHYRSSFKDSAALLSSSLWQITSSKQAIRAWICCATCSASISCYEVLFCHLGKMS